MDNSRSQDLARTTFQLLALGALIATSFWIVQPFLTLLADWVSESEPSGEQTQTESSFAVREVGGLGDIS